MGDFPSIQLSNEKFLVRSIKLYRTLDQVSGLSTSTSTLCDTSFDSTLPSATSTRSPEDVLDCENIFNWPLWEELYQGLMDGFLDVSKGL